MMESAGYEAAAVRIYNHSPEKETNVLVIIIIITSSKRYCISRKKYILFISSLCPKFQASKNCKKKREWSNSSDIFIPLSIYLETNSKSLEKNLSSTTNSHETL